MRTARSLLILALAAGCAPINTFVNETSDLASGRTQQTVYQAQRREYAAQTENVTLHRQLHSLQAQRNSLRQQLAASQAQLRSIERKLAGETGANQAQRVQYQRLAAKQRELQHALAVESMTPPTDATAAAEQKAKLDALAAEKDALSQQVAALQKAL